MMIGHRVSLSSRDRDRRIARAAVLVTVAIFAAACVNSPEPRLEASPSIEAAGAASPTQAPRTPVSNVPSPTEPTEPIERPDATVVLTGGRCEQTDGKSVVDPGVLAIEFANKSGLDGVFKVVRFRQDRELDDLRGGWGVAGGWGGFRSPSTTGIWSSPRKITSGRWAVVCWKDLDHGPHGLTPVRVGVAGPIEVAS
jgi:hypothetical protein